MEILIKRLCQETQSKTQLLGQSQRLFHLSQLKNLRSKMKTASCFIYMLLSLLYLSYADGTMIWYGVGQITILWFICTLGLFILNHRHISVVERLFLQFVLAFTFGRSLYTMYCVFQPDGWVIYNTDVFNFISCSSFAIFLLHIAYKYSHNFK